MEEFKSRDVEALSFQIFDPESKQYYKAYRQNPVDVLDFRGVLKISSIEFFINLNKVKTEDLNFDERFGLGAQYPSGKRIYYWLICYKRNTRYLILIKLLFSIKRKHQKPS